MSFFGNLFGSGGGTEGGSGASQEKAQKPIINPNEERSRINAAKNRMQDYMENSGGSQGSTEAVPGASGDGNVRPILTLNPTEKRQPKFTRRSDTGA
jgi:hypothetical protein